jgi:hypothetical protein
MTNRRPPGEWAINDVVKPGRSILLQEATKQVQTQKLLLTPHLQ